MISFYDIKKTYWTQHGMSGTEFFTWTEAAIVNISNHIKENTVRNLFLNPLFVIGA